MGNVMITTCNNLVKISPEQFDDMKVGKFSDHKDVKCFLNCMFEKMGAVSKSRL